MYVQMQTQIHMCKTPPKKKKEKKKEKKSVLYAKSTCICHSRDCDLVELPILPVEIVICVSTGKD